MLKHNWKKPVILVLLALILIVTPLIVACAKPEAPAAAPAQKAAAKFPETIAMSCSSSGASGYALGVAFSQYMKEELGIKVIVSEAGASGSRIKQVTSGDAELGNTISYEVLGNAWTGTGMYQGQGRQPVRAIMVDLISGFAVFGKTSSGIKTIPDIRGKKFAALNKGIPQHETFVGALLEYHKMKWEDFKVIEQAAAKEATDGVKAGTIDLGIRTAGRNGTTDLNELCRTDAITVLNFTDDEINYCIKKEPVFTKITTPEGIYVGNKEVNSVAFPFYIVAHEKLTDDFVYAICKVLMDTADMDKPSRYAKAHPDRDFTLKIACAKPVFAAYHTGAVKYYKDRKVWTDEHEKAQQALLAK